MSDVVQFRKPGPEASLRVSVGVRDGVVALQVGVTTLRLTADLADELSADLRRFALELRNGGRLT